MLIIKFYRFNCGERNGIKLNLIAESCMHNDNATDLEMKTETEVKKSCNRDDSYINKNVKEDEIQIDAASTPLKGDTENTV